MAQTKSNKDSRGRLFATVIYPDSVNYKDNWQAILEETHIPAFISPLHDRDKDPDGNPKKPHYHVMIMYEGKKSISQAQELFEKIDGVGCLQVADKRGMARYFTHMDNPDKAQYKPEEVISLSGADYMYVCGVVVDRYRVIGEMQDFIKANGIFYFCDILDYARNNNQEWYRCLCDNSERVISSYIKSLAYKEKHETY